MAEIVDFPKKYLNIIGPDNSIVYVLSNYFPDHYNTPLHELKLVLELQIALLQLPPSHED